VPKCPSQKHYFLMLRNVPGKHRSSILAPAKHHLSTFASSDSAWNISFPMSAPRKTPTQSRRTQRGTQSDFRQQSWKQ
jgi:hypothetical protein